MKKYITIILAIITLPALGADNNPMFGKNADNAIALYVSQGTGPGSLFKLVDPFLWEFEPMTNLMVQYSQPASIFRLPSRINLAFVQNFGYGHDRGLSFMAVWGLWGGGFVGWGGFFFCGGGGGGLGGSPGPFLEKRMGFCGKIFF